MQRQWQPVGSWGTNVLLAVGVVATILMAFLLAASDELQMRIPPPRPTQQVAAVTEDGATPTFTAVPPTVALPTPTATSMPASPTVTVEKKPSATPVAVMPSCGVVPEDWVAYDLEPGDTLFRLAVNSGATVSALMVANCLDSTRLYAGMTIHLPLEPPPPPPICSGPPSDWPRYTVQRGDTLFSLARARGSTVYGVMSANCMVSTRINAGQIIYLPALAPAPTATDTPAPPPTEPPPPPPTEPPPPTATDPPPPTPTNPPPPTATAPPPSATSPPTATAPVSTPPTETATLPPSDEDPTPPAPTATEPPPPTATAPAPNATPTATSEPLPTPTGTRLPPDDEATPTPPLPEP